MNEESISREGNLETSQDTQRHKGYLGPCYLGKPENKKMSDFSCYQRRVVVQVKKGGIVEYLVLERIDVFMPVFVIGCFCGLVVKA